MTTRFLTPLLVVSAFIASALLPCRAQTARLPALRVSENRRFLVDSSGKPFFYLADTAWELFHRLTREEAVRYVDLRASQRYTAIQAVALAELDGLTDPNPYGDLPLTNNDPTKPAVTPGNSPSNAAAYDYWDHVDYIIDQANQRGLYVALLPTWGRWTTTFRPQDQTTLTPQNAQAYGEFLGKRYARKAIIWILGGDRPPTNVEATWRAMAKGIAIGVSGSENYDAVLMTYHPRGGETSSTTFHNDTWLDFNMHQTGHGLSQTVKPWARIERDYQRTPAKPVLDGEPLYEDHPLQFRARDFGYSFDAHIRQRAWWSVFAGSFGHTYGNHSVWQMYAPGRKPVNGPLFYWNEAIHRPGAAQMRHLRALIESRPVLDRVPDDALIPQPLDDADRITATRGKDYLFVYSAQGRKFSVNLGQISGAQLKAWWFNPRTGTAAAAIEGSIDNKGARECTPPSEGFGSDWVLVLDDAAKGFPAPGRSASR